uniref:G_PROTEIN_RECEP_F1_2 domain-containing protein n=1 Tax=Ascaris lumbricoides TaxID=6252 RepID=A0A0M3I119_ASCLU
MPLSPSNYYRSLCCHVQTFVIAYCVAEIVIISLTFATRLEHPLMVCRSVNMTSVGEFSLGRGGARLKVHEARICYTCSPLLFLILLHLAFDFLALVRFALILTYT